LAAPPRRQPRTPETLSYAPGQMVSRMCEL
jgi:hypothetical protein